MAELKCRPQRRPRRHVLCCTNSSRPRVCWGGLCRHSGDRRPPPPRWSTTTASTGCSHLRVYARGSTNSHARSSGIPTCTRHWVLLQAETVNACHGGTNAADNHGGLSFDRRGRHATVSGTGRKVPQDATVVLFGLSGMSVRFVRSHRIPVAIWRVSPLGNWGQDRSVRSTLLGAKRDSCAE